MYALFTLTNTKRVPTLLMLLVLSFKKGKKYFSHASNIIYFYEGGLASGYCRFPFWKEKKRKSNNNKRRGTHLFNPPWRVDDETIICIFRSPPSPRPARQSAPLMHASQPSSSSDPPIPAWPWRRSLHFQQATVEPAVQRRRLKQKQQKLISETKIDDTHHFYNF